MVIKALMTSQIKGEQTIREAKKRKKVLIEQPGKCNFSLHLLGEKFDGWVGGEIPALTVCLALEQLWFWLLVPTSFF